MIYTQKSKVLLVLTICFLFLIGVVLIAKIYNFQGVCWSIGNALSNDARYQNAMNSLIKLELKNALLSRGGRSGMSVGQVAGAFWCEPIDCDVWVAPPVSLKKLDDLINIKQIKKKRIERRLGQSLNINNLLSLFEWRLIKQTIKKEGYIEGENLYSIVVTERGSPSYYTRDCCRILTLSEWNTLKNQREIKTAKSLRTNSKARYLGVTKIYIPELTLRKRVTDKQDIEVKRWRDFHQYMRLYELDSCGEIKGETHVDAFEFNMAAKER